MSKRVRKRGVTNAASADRLASQHRAWSYRHFEQSGGNAEIVMRASAAITTRVNVFLGAIPREVADQADAALLQAVYGVARVHYNETRDRQRVAAEEAQAAMEARDDDDA